MATVDGDALLEQLCESIQRLTLEAPKKTRMQDIEAAVSGFKIDRACLSCYMAFIMPYLMDEEKPVLYVACSKDCECDFKPVASDLQALCD